MKIMEEDPCERILPEPEELPVLPLAHLAILGISILSIGLISLKLN